MQVYSSSNVTLAGGINILIYGKAGEGKTRSLAFCPKPIILAAESGLLSIRTLGVPFIPITNLDELREAWAWLKQGQEYQTVCIDSISEVCELAYTEVKEVKKMNPRDSATFYPELRSTVLPLLRSFRALPYHFVATSKETARKHAGNDYASPGVIGSKLTEDMPYIFDIVLYYGVEDNQHVVRSKSSSDYVAKDRTGLLPEKYDGDVVRDYRVLESVITEVLKVE